jgi:hypothetical protein
MSAREIIISLPEGADEQRSTRAAIERVKKAAEALNLNLEVHSWPDGDKPSLFRRLMITTKGSR